MTHIMKMRWGMYKDELRKVLSERTDLNSCDYDTLVKLTFETVYNKIEGEYSCKRLDLDKITMIDNGDYQGTLIFVIPFDTYQPDVYEHIMTYIGYGSCSGCDALKAAQGLGGTDELTEVMNICKDLVCNTIKPYNHGWREDKEWSLVEEEAV